LTARLPKKQSLITVEFYNKLADILYYKNKSFNTKIIKSCPFKNKGMKFDKSCSCEACNYYLKGLEVFLDCYDNRQSEKILGRVIELVDRVKKKEKEFSSLELTIFAMSISDFGDTLLTCLDGLIDLNHLLLLCMKDIGDFVKEKGEIENQIKYIVVCFKAAAYLYRKAGDHKSFSFQNTKLLYLIKNILLEGKISEPIEFTVFRNSIDKLSTESINGIYSAYEHIHTYEINRFKNILNDNADKLLKPPDISLNRISLNTEITEIVVLHQEIKLLITKDINEAQRLEAEVNNLVNPYNLISSMYVRFLTLRLKAMSNQKQLGILFKNESLLNEFPDYEPIIHYYYEYFKDRSVKDVEELEFLIKDSIFCNNEILKILYTFGYSYFINHSLIAETHENLYYWCKFYISYLELIDSLNYENEPDWINYGKQLEPKSIRSFVNETKKENGEILEKIKKSTIKLDLGSLIEPDNLPFIMPAYQCEKAISEYYAAVESHSQGRAYKNLIENMNYLNDDFNDRLFHFSIGLERFSLNRGVIKEKISRLKEERESSQINNISLYIN
jgi:hypothetical protein